MINIIVINLLHYLFSSIHIKIQSLKTQTIKRISNRYRLGKKPITTQ